MAFTTSGQETEWALFLQPRSPHGGYQGVTTADVINEFSLNVNISESYKRQYSVARAARAE